MRDGKTDKIIFNSMNILRSFYFRAALMATLLLVIGAVSLFLVPSRHVRNVKEKQKMEPNDWMAMQRTYPYDHINPEAVLAAIQQVKVMRDAGVPMTTPWTFTGPTNIGGRITDVEIPPDNMNTIYLGAASGGVLKSTNFGITWTNLFGSLPVISVGDIAIDPNNTSTIYVGTGEANASSYSFLGNGMYKSTDAGQTWQQIGLTNSAYIGRVVVDYNNSQRVFVAACGQLFSYNSERGVYRSTDGGQNWQQVLYLTDSTAAVDLVQDPVHPQVLYAAMWERTRGLEYRNSYGNTSGIWKSTDGGDNWSKLSTGLPTGDDIGRIGLTISKSNPVVLYASYDLDNNEVGVYRTTDAGQTWVRTQDGALYGLFSNFGWYFGQIRVNPQNSNQVFVMGVDMMRSDNGGNSWIQVNNNDIHVDHHAMYFDETNNRILEGNDGGLYYTTNSGSSWTKINNLPLTQFYAIDIDYLSPNRIYGGTQDNNSIRTLTGNINDWEPILGGDGMYTLVDYTNSNIIYAEYQYGNLYRSDDLGYSMYYISGPMSGDIVNWSAPLVIDLVDPAVLYFGTYRVWKTFDRGNTWSAISGDLTRGGPNYFHTITTLAISPINPAIVIAGTGDGKVQVSTNGGVGWTDRSVGLPDRWVMHVIADPFDVNTIYAACSGFRWDEPQPHMLKSTNLGQSWTDISAGLPDLPVDDIILDPMIQGRIIVGTDAGVFGSADGGLSWFWIWDDLPAVAVCALKFHPGTRKVVAGTYGLSTWSASIDDIYTGFPVHQGNTRLNLSVFPNPLTTTSRLNFHLPWNEDVTIRISSAIGQTVSLHRAGPLSKGAQVITLPGTTSLAPGIYFISIEGKRINGVVKAVKY
jgi:photosystem II stability/assembly factor-like uncharacterized protein